MAGKYPIVWLRSTWLLALLMLVLCQNVRAQQCPPNMLHFGEDGGHVRAVDNAAVRLDKAFTIEVWIKPSAATDRSTILEKSNGVGVNYSITLGPQNTISARVLGPTGVITLSSDVVQNITDWHHVALVYRPSDSLILYIDGEISNGVETSTSFLLTGSDSLRIGRSVPGEGKPFFGSIDELRLWKIARTQAEIKGSLYSIVSHKSTGLSAYFTFDDEPAAGKIYDNIRKGLIGELKGAAQITPSTSPVQGTASPYKLQIRESSIRLPRMACTARFDTVVHVRNLGMDSVNVNFLGLVYGSAFSIAGPERLVLPADSTFWGEIRIQFNPHGSGIYKDSLTIGSTSSCAGMLSIELVDTVVAAEIQVTPTSITLPKTLSCALPQDRTVTIKNPGPITITVNRAFAEEEIGVYPVDLDLPFTLEPGQSKVVTIRFDEGLGGLQSTRIIFGIDRCDLMAAVTVNATREVIAFDVPDLVEFSERTLFDQVKADTTILFTNSSSRDITVTNVSLQTHPSFRLQRSISNWTLPPGESLSIPIEFLANTCGTFSTKLRIFGVPCGIDTSIQLSINVVSPKPDLAEVIDIGFTCSAKDTFVVIANPYDRPITLRSYDVSDPAAFTVRTSFPITILPNNDTIIRIRFNPSSEGEYSTSITLNDENCGSSTITLAGSFGTKALVFDKTNLDFGSGCNTGRVTRVFTLTNTSQRSVTLIDTNVTGTNRYYFKGLVLPVTIDAGASKRFDIEFLPVMGQVTRGVAGFVTREDCETEAIQLYGSREALALTFEPTVDFDTVCPTTSSVLGVSVVNLGIDSIRLDEIRVQGTGFSLFEPINALRLGQNTIKIKFAPPAQGDFFGTMTVRPMNCDNVYVVQLRGSGGSNPKLSLSVSDLKFGTVRVGEGRLLCFDVVNTSCVPLTLTDSSFLFVDSAFHLDPVIQDALPITLNNGSRQSICVIYHPKLRGENESELEIEVIGADRSSLLLSGKGIAPVLEVSETLLDFGFVPVHTEKSLSLIVKNVGDDNAVITSDLIPNYGFNFDPSGDFILAPNEHSSIVVTFTPDEKRPYSPTLRLGEIGYEKYVSLRGVGAARGLVVDRTIVDYGKVRLNTPVTQQLVITANADVTLQSYEFFRPVDSQHYSIVFDTLLPYELSTTTDVIASVTFCPRVEGEIIDTLVLLDGSGEKLKIPLIGIGVEAHIKTEDLIDFLVVGFEDTLYKEYTIENAGTYPLKVTSVSTSLPFFIEPVPVSLEIEPNEVETLRVGFSPRTAKEVRGELIIASDAAEGERKIILVGRGGPVTQSKPRVAYHVPNIETQIGEHPLISIKVSGSQLEKIASDSFMIKLRYDPWMLYVYGYSDFATLTNGFDIELTREDDSTIVISGTGSQLDLRDGASLIDLRSEALFGPRARTAMQIVEAYPSTISTLANATGELYITNCDDQQAGAIYKGAYAVEEVFPNPIRDRATIQYKLGYHGGAEIMIHDALGRLVKVISLPERPKGEHEIDIDLHDLPNGHYTGLFRSREFMKRIDLVIQH